MNKHNVKVSQVDGMLRAEWADRAPDDTDRYNDDSIIIVVEVPASAGERAMWSELARAYDNWVKERE